MPSSIIKLRRRSWVIGRGGAIFSISRAIALASYAPTQIGNIVSLSTSFRIMMGVPLLGSIISALIFTSISIKQHLVLALIGSLRPTRAARAGTPRLTYQFAIQTIRLTFGNQDLDDITRSRLIGLEVYNLV